MNKGTKSVVRSKDNALPIVSCHKVYVAKKSGEKNWDTPRYLENLTELGIEKNFSNDGFYAEGTLKHNESTLTDIPVTMALGDLTDDDEVYLLGHRKDINGMIIRNKNDVAPDVALMFTVQKANNIFKGYVYYDGKFVPTGVSAATSEGSANYQPKTITGSFKPLENGDTDASKVLTSLSEVEEFFKKVPIPDEE